MWFAKYWCIADLFETQSNTILLPSDAGNPSSLIAQSLQIYKHICQTNSLKSGKYLTDAPEETELEEEELDSTDLPSLSSGMPSPDMPDDHDKTFSLQRRNKDKHWVSPPVRVPEGEETLFLAHCFSTSMEL